MIKSQANIATRHDILVYFFQANVVGNVATSSPMANRRVARRRPVQRIPRFDAWSSPSTRHPAGPPIPRSVSHGQSVSYFAVPPRAHSTTGSRYAVRLRPPPLPVYRSGVRHKYLRVVGPPRYQMKE